MSAFGRAIFRPATVRRAFREVRLPTPSFRVFKRLPIWCESIVRLLLTRTWRLFSEPVPASLRLAQSAVCNLLPIGRWPQRQNVGPFSIVSSQRGKLYFAGELALQLFA